MMEFVNGKDDIPYMGVSEDSVPLNPMVNDHVPYLMAISLGIYPIFRQTHMQWKIKFMFETSNQMLFRTGG